MIKLEDISNELLLCVWDQLSVTDVIYSFSNLNLRIHRLLLEFCGLYKEIDLRYCSLSVFRFFCRQLTVMNEWRLNLTVLKLGNRYRCSQANLFANEAAKVFIANHFARQGRKSDNPPKDFLRIQMSFNQQLQVMFPRLTSLFVFQDASLDEDCRDTLLYIVASGSAMRSFTWRFSPNQNRHTRAFFDWLFQCSIKLNSFELENPLRDKGFELTYEYTIIKGFIPHQSLTCLTINILNVSTLCVLLHYLPKLQYLDIHISEMLIQSNIIDQHLPTNLNYSEKIHTFRLRHILTKGNGYQQLEQFVEKFAQSLENLSLSMYQCCEGQPDLNYNGHRLSTLCGKLSRLQSLHFAVQVQLFEKPNNQTLVDITRTFSTPFWLDGPFGCKRVCVDFHQFYGLLQMFSLPYTFDDIGLFRTIDLLNIRFNTYEERKKTPVMLSIALEPLWLRMNYLFISVIENQKVPLSFFQALQCSRSQGKTLTILQKRGIIADNVADTVQLIHFSILELKNPIDDNGTYNLQELLSWLRLLPNIKCLVVHLPELKYWFTIDYHSQYLDSFLQRIERLFVDCTYILSAKMNEEIMEPILAFLIDNDRFPHLKCLCFMNCKNISAAWDNVNQWIDFILTRINEHRLVCVRFDFNEKGREITDLCTGDETITITDHSCIIDVHRFVQENHVTLWMERKWQ